MRIFEAHDVSSLMQMIKIPRDEYDLACPHCKKVMREKDFTFKYIGEGEGNIWTHECDPTKPFVMPSKIYESRAVKTNKSGFSKEETEPPTLEDKEKLKKIINDKKLPDVAEDGKAYVVVWADGRGVFACNSKKYLTKWLNDVGSWAEIVSIKYGEPKHDVTRLKIVKESSLTEMPAWNDGDKTISQYMGTRHRMDIDDRYKEKHGNKLEDFRTPENYQVKVYSNKIENQLNYHVFYDYKEVAAFHWLKDGKKFWTTTSAAVAPEHQGKGLAFAAYTHMIDKYMHTLCSDATLTGETGGKGSFDLWVKLGKKYPFKYVYNSDPSSRKLTPVEGFTRDMMEYDFERFVVSDTDLLMEEQDLDELSLSDHLQDAPSWNNPDYDKKLLKSKPVYVFEFDFKDIGNAEVGLYKTPEEYFFINKNNGDKIASIEYKKINVMQDGKVINGVECDFKVTTIGKYRGKGFAGTMYDTIIKHNTAYPGMWGSDSKLSPVNQGIWKKMLTKYPHDIMISIPRTPTVWIPITDTQNIKKFGLEYFAQKIKEYPDIIWDEKWDKERIRILLKSSLNESVRSMLREVFFT